ncbi:PPC domain-containing DNA-binding protein [Fibrella aquatilis]|uniref:DNA-binding protein n=1 Tax=Fibrella aquatilis TaxID=2817059 RepID=A0A939JWV7_9BACT|nr:PPC domain-containing DNA-binding protein [Fibrella aquatilis]MBO0930399.1 DNA-binding protein [Fibrella aquatilis]
MPAILLFTLYLLVATMETTTAQPTVSAQPSAMTTLSFRLKPGQDLKLALDELVQNQHIAAGTLLTCVGSLTDVSLRLANQDGPTHYQGHFEIVSLVGTLAASGSHVHLSVSDSTGRTLGGHLMVGCKVYTTAEIVVGILPDVVFSREPDPTFGYRELVVRKKKSKPNRD